MQSAISGQPYCELNNPSFANYSFNFNSPKCGIGVGSPDQIIYFFNTERKMDYGECNLNPCNGQLWNILLESWGINKEHIKWGWYASCSQRGLCKRWICESPLDNNERSILINKGFHRVGLGACSATLYHYEHGTMPEDLRNEFINYGSCYVGDIKGNVSIWRGSFVCVINRGQLSDNDYHVDSQGNIDKAHIKPLPVVFDFENVINKYECFEGDEKCINESYYTCMDHQWYDNGRIIGKCGVVLCNEGEEKCIDDGYYTCVNGDWFSEGRVVGKCGVVNETLTNYTSNETTNETISEPQITEPTKEKGLFERFIDWIINMLNKIKNI